MVHVLLYVPNLIGKVYVDYGRLIFLLLAIAVYNSNPLLFIFSYVISALLDALDGMAARYLKQTSTIGMVLDMSIDRLSYMLIQTINFILWPRYSFVFAILIFLDGISHLSIVSASLVSGNSTHKLKDDETHWLLRLYYGTNLLFTLCFCSEGFAVIAYLGYWYTFTGLLEYVFNGMLWFTAIGTFVKQVVNVVQIEHAGKMYSLFLDSIKKL